PRCCGRDMENFETLCLTNWRTGGLEKWRIELRDSRQCQSVNIPYLNNPNTPFLPPPAKNLVLSPIKPYGPICKAFLGRKSRSFSHRRSGSESVAFLERRVDY